MQKASKTGREKRRTGARRARGGGDSAPGAGGAAGPTPEVASALAALGLEEAAAGALLTQVTRALEAGVRSGKRAVALGKARGLAGHRTARGIPPARLIPLVLATRDALQQQRQEQDGGGAGVREERLARAADAALLGLAEATPRKPVSTVSDEAVTNLQRDLEAAREVLQRILSLTPDALLTIRDSGRIGLWNSAASRMTGRRRWEMQRRGLAAAFRERSLFDELLAELGERGRITRREVALVNANGDDVPARLFAVRLKSAGGSHGDPDAFLLLFHDLSEVHHIRQRLIETEKLSAMAKIAGSVAHEFRNPLNSLFLSTDLLEDELEGRASVRKAIAPTLSAIREEIERLNQIITHYLSLSKISSASPERMDLGEVAAAFSEEYAARLPEGQVELRLRADDGAHGITADPNQVRRILVNLVENAVQAVLGEEVEDEKPTRRGRVTIYVRRMRRSVKVTVKDNGPGIPEELRERVFEPFFTSRAGGSGLGLYLVREVAIASGGTLTLSSTPGRGTSVSIRWPHAAPADDENKTKS